MLSTKLHIKRVAVFVTIRPTPQAPWKLWSKEDNVYFAIPIWLYPLGTSNLYTDFILLEGNWHNNLVIFTTIFVILILYFFTYRNVFCSQVTAIYADHEKKKTWQIITFVHKIWLLPQRNIFIHFIRFH